MKRAFSMTLVAILLVFFSANAHAGQSGSYDEKAVASFYRGKTVTILVGHSAGGGFDTYARVISRHLGKYIPGNPNLVVNNMPGAGTLISANYTFNQAPKDGTLINSFDGGIVPSQIYGSSAVQFDLSKAQLHWRPGYFQVHHGRNQKAGDYQDGRVHLGWQADRGRRSPEYRYRTRRNAAQGSARRECETGQRL